MKQKIIKLVKLSTTEDTGFSFPCISIRTGSLIRIKSVSESAEYIGQLFISIIAPTGFGL